MFRMSGESDELKLLAEWRKVTEGLRPQVLVGAWRRGERNVAKLAKALGVSRDTVYADLREQGIDYRDRKSPVEDDPGLFDYEYVSAWRLDSMVASSAVQIAMRAFVDGYNPAVPAGRYRLLESLLDQPDTKIGDLTRCQVALARGRLEVPGVGRAAVWRGTTGEADGRTVGLGLLGLSERDRQRARAGSVHAGPAGARGRGQRRTDRGRDRVGSPAAPTGSRTPAASRTSAVSSRPRSSRASTASPRPSPPSRPCPRASRSSASTCTSAPSPASARGATPPSTRSASGAQSGLYRRLG